MDNVRKKVLLDLFASPWSIIPIAGGLSAWMLSWGVDGSLALNLAGLVGVMGGVGVLATRLIFGLEKITEDAFTYLNAQQQLEQERELDDLTERLSGDDDPNTETYLSDLRTLYKSFVEDVEKGQLSGAVRPVLAQVQRLFKAAVKHLEYSHELWARASKLQGPAKQKLLQERRRVIEEVAETIDHLGTSIQQFHTFRLQDSDSELSKLREELDATMQVAKRAEERVSGLGRQVDLSAKEFE